MFGENQFLLRVEFKKSLEIFSIPTFSLTNNEFHSNSTTVIPAPPN